MMMNLYKTANLLPAAGSKSTFGKGFAKLRDKFIYTIFFIMEQQQAASPPLEKVEPKYNQKNNKK